MKYNRIALSLFATLAVLVGGYSRATADDLDPFDRLFNKFQNDEVIPDSDKSSEELVADASNLFQQERPLDARTKLLSALKKDPKNYRAMMLMAGYYMQTVGHFKLALRYTLQAIDLFEEKNGRPPYSNLLARAEHMQLLYLLSQARLNLDDYQGSLDVLDEFAGYGYYDDWYAGSRSWVLMKLGRLDDAIKVARTAALIGSEKGRILNMLGILLSMKDQRTQSLEVFRQAIGYELSLGKAGQPATPLNNSAEVLKEMFEDSKAETAWLKTLRLPDGCDHVLPALNLVLISIEQEKYKQAEQAIRSFEECNAQFPLRNGEEHRALVALARGRIALRTGFPNKALKLLEEAQGSTQWFGKIGTDQDDMQAATLQSLSQALAAQANWLRATPAKSWRERISNEVAATAGDIRSWWMRRKAAKQLAGSMRDFEDFEVRFTDSFLEYSTVGDIVGSYPPASVKKKIALTRQHDERAPAYPYYLAYLAESQLQYGDNTAAEQNLEDAAANLRTDTDVALKHRITVLQLKQLDFDSKEYREQAIALYRENPAWLKNFGLPLPVATAQVNNEMRALLLRGGFIEDSQSPVTITGFTDGTVRIEDRGIGGKPLVTGKDVGDLATKTFQYS